MYNIVLEKESFLFDEREFGRWGNIEDTKLSSLGVLAGGNVVFICLFVLFLYFNPLPPPLKKKQWKPGIKISVKINYI